MIKLLTAMTKLKFDPTISAGNLVQVIVIIFGIASAWANLNNRVDLHTREIKRINDIVDKVSDTQTKVSENLTVLTAIVNERTISHGRAN